jgi:hypothetical protein
LLLFLFFCIESFRYGNSTWYLVHFILIATIFLAGFYLGTKF